MIGATVTFVTVFDSGGLQNVFLAQAYSKRNFKEDWELCLKTQKAIKGPTWSIFEVYKMLEDMGWSITSLHCTEVSY